MNQRNVKALAEAFDAMLNAWFAQDDSGVEQYDGPTTGFAADFFAANGVLVPSALTDEEASTIAYGVIEDLGKWLRDVEAARAEGIGYLERIAKGEEQ
jgi:hypothetical protein